MRGYTPKAIDRLPPEIHRGIIREITTESVDIGPVYPGTHITDHGITHDRVGKIQRGHIRIAAEDFYIPIPVMQVPIRMLPDPGMIPGSLVDHPVQHDRHSPAVRSVHQV